MRACKHLWAIVFLALLSSAALAQQAVTPTAQPTLTADQVETVDRLITVLEDDQLRVDLLAHLRTLVVEPETTAPTEVTSDPSVEGEEAVNQPGLIDALSTWTNTLIDQLPTTTFGVPIDRKASQAGTQITSRFQAGLETGQLVGFALWAVPGLLITIAGGLLLRRAMRRMTAPHVPVRKRWLATGLLLHILGHIALFLAVTLGASLVAPSGIGAQIFATLAIGILLAMLGTTLAISSLSVLASWRGARLIRYCQLRFYPWLLAISVIAIFAALGNEPTLRRVVGWSAADIVGFALNLAAAFILLLFIIRHKRAVGRLIFGAACSKPASDNVLNNATRRLAKHWPLLAYAFLGLSVVSVVGGQRDNDVLSQMLWSFGTVLAGLVVISILNRFFTPKPPKYRYRVSPVQQVVGKALMRVLRLTSDAVATFGIILALSWIWGFNLWLWLTTDGMPLTAPLLAAATVVVVAWLIWVALDAWIATALTPREGLNWSQRRSSRVQTLLPLVRNGAMIVLIVLTGIAVLANIGVDVTPLIAGAGVFGLAISFGSQQLVQDVITGIFILAEDTIAIGDTINTGDRSGVVESISLRTIRLRDSDGALHSIPFSTVKALKNSSRNFGVLRPRYTVPSAVDPMVVMEEMRLTAKTLRENPRYSGSITTDLHDLGIDEINAGSVVVSGSMRTSPLRQTELARAFNGKLLEGLAAKGIAL
ncbi:MAG: mechanosensitive ion channel [Candidatus Devosia phytovorans]|uniref:Mechanosensitive ion channel n=1 Tax=Candidatus Devosia phytovorans TaxID=3121372 RepID=A0AAJ6B2Q1_9HYPH|nr:mechanosensitive ion channel domain-containing protein [Devosia sp.]WEK05708.1 MAG: mechanosensitive ion channel [Devosia sp.]